MDLAIRFLNEHATLMAQRSPQGKCLHKKLYHRVQELGGPILSIVVLQLRTEHRLHFGLKECEGHERQRTQLRSSIKDSLASMAEEDLNTLRQLCPDAFAFVEAPNS